jgi:hypothetical protein
LDPWFFSVFVPAAFATVYALALSVPTLAVRAVVLVSTVTVRTAVVVVRTVLTAAVVVLTVAVRSAVVVTVVLTFLLEK